MRKSLLIQFVLVSCALICAFVLNILLLSIAVEQKDVNYTHVVFSAVFFLSGLLAQRILYQLRDEKLAEEC